MALESGFWGWSLLFQGSPRQPHPGIGVSGMGCGVERAQANGYMYMCCGWVHARRFVRGWASTSWGLCGWRGYSL